MHAWHRAAGFGRCWRRSGPQVEVGMDRRGKNAVAQRHFRNITICESIAFHKSSCRGTPDMPSAHTSRPAGGRFSLGGSDGARPFSEKIPLQVCVLIGVSGGLEDTLSECGKDVFSWFRHPSRQHCTSTCTRVLAIILRHRHSSTSFGANCTSSIGVLGLHGKVHFHHLRDLPPCPSLVRWISVAHDDKEKMYSEMEEVSDGCADGEDTVVYDESAGQAAYQALLLQARARGERRIAEERGRQAVAESSRNGSEDSVRRGVHCRLRRRLARPEGPG